ncbi:unnamed protein product [Spodoptera exigua]|nr:unnamed protein product [Spodoptera exigua]
MNVELHLSLIPRINFLQLDGFQLHTLNRRIQTSVASSLERKNPRRTVSRFTKRTSPQSLTS